MDLDSILRIAKWEVSKSAPSITWRNAVLGTAGVIFAVLIIALTANGIVLGDGLYTVGVAEDSPYYEPVSDNPEFVVMEPSEEAFRNGELDVYIRPDAEKRVTTEDGRVTNLTVSVAEPIEGTRTARSNAALTELRETIRAYNDNRMRNESNQSAAFPVGVDIQYVDLSTNSTVGGGESGSDGESSDAESNGVVKALNDAVQSVRSLIPQSVLNLVSPVSSSVEQAKALVTGTVSSGSSAAPFQFQSVVLALFFLAPMNFIVQAYGSSVMTERLNHRGELMLVTPTSRADIIAGKTLPYVLILLGIALLLSIVTGAGVLSVFAVLPFAAVFLGGVFVAAMLSRSFKELTFVTVAISVGVISYGFIPAMFTNVHPIALISPLTVIVEQIQQTPVTITEFLFSTVPLTLVGVSFFVIGAGLYREEDMFAQRPLREKFIDALANWVTSVRRVPFMTAGLIPLVFAAELLALTIVFPLPNAFGIVGLMLAVGVIEETAKTLHVYAGFERGRFEKTLRNGVLTGILTGLSFFVVEKLMTVVQVAGLNRLDVGQAVFNSATMSGVSLGPVQTAGLFLLPLALHIIASTIATVAAASSRVRYLYGLVAAMLIHALYDLLVVSLIVFN